MSPSRTIFAGLLVGLAFAARAQAPLALPDAIRTAWTRNAALKAGEAMVLASQQDELAARDQRLPTLEVHARALRTDEPVAAFGLKLDEQKIAAPDFAPDKLNAPDAAYGVGLGASIMQVLYAGGRVSAAHEARSAQAGAEAHSQERRRQQLALSVVEAFLGAQVAEQAARYADEQLAHARETERYARLRASEQQLPEAEALRATAARAQAQAEQAGALQRVQSARSGLSLLLGEPVADRALSQALDEPLAAPGDEQGPRPDLQAAQLRVEAARAAQGIAQGALLPQVFVQVGVDTMRSSFSQGATWTLAAVGARWQLALPDLRESRAAQARQEAAAAQLRFEKQQAEREVDEARRALATAQARIVAAREGLAAAESARSLREARHKQGLLPLTDVLDAQAAVAGARTLLLRTQFEARLSRAQLQLALGQPVEGVQP